MRCNSDIFAMYFHSTKSEYQPKTATTNKPEQQQQRKKVKPVKRKKRNHKYIHSHSRHSLSRAQRRIDKSIDICIIRNVIMLLPYFVLLAFAFSPFLLLLLLSLMLHSIMLAFDSNSKITPPPSNVRTITVKREKNFNFPNKQIASLFSCIFVISAQHILFALLCIFFSVRLLTFSR